MRQYRQAVRWSSILGAAVVLALSGHPGEAQQTPETPRPSTGREAPARAYVLRKGDHVAVAISPQKEYDCEAIVLPDGNVFLRNIGTFAAENKTLAELGQDVKTKLSEELVKPKVTVTLLRMAPEDAPKPIARRFITVSGGVAAPGPVEFEEGLTLQRALVLAGGLLREANHQDIRVFPKLTVRMPASSVEAPTSSKDRVTADVKVAVDPEKTALSEQKSRGTFNEKGRYFPVVLPDDAAAGAPTALALKAIGAAETVKPPAPQNENLVLWDGDAIEVRLRPVQPQSTVRLTGLVRTPGLVNLTPRMRLEDLFKEGGLSPLADPKRVQIFRKGEKVAIFDDHGKRVPGDSIDLQAEVQKEPSKKLQLQPDDEVFVPPVVGKVIVIGGVQNPGWRPLKKHVMGEAGPQTPPAGGSPADPGRIGKGQKAAGKPKKSEPQSRTTAAAEPPDDEKWQTIREFFLQNDKEITAGNQDLPSTYNPNLADLKEVEVIRNGGADTFKVNLIEVTRNAARPDNIWLKPGDVIYLPPKGRPNRGPLYYLRDLPYLGFLFGLF